ncbi:MAG: aspartyl protease family protein [Prolixibacteraceae bacterium]
MRCFFFSVLLLVFSFNAKSQPSAELAKILESAVKQHDPSIIKPYLSADFRVHVYVMPQAYGILANIFKSDKVLGKFEYDLALDSLGKIKRIKYLDQLYGLDTDKESALVANIPFVFRDKKIIVKMKLNDSPRVLSMLFDTGADGVGMKKETADAVGLVETRKQQTSIVGASTEIVISAGNTLKFDSLQIKNQNIGIFPSYLDDLDGLFGANFLHNYITYIDFDNSVIRLYSLGSFKYPEGGSFVPMVYDTGLPGVVSKVKLNSGKEITGKFHFDTGAGYPLILFSPFVGKNDLEKDFKIQSRSVNNSFGHQTPTVLGIFDHLQIGKFSIPHFTGTLQSSDGKENWTVSGDGSLGMDIIKKFNCIINVLDLKIYLIPNKSFTDPLDFWLGPVMFGVKNGNLVVRSIVPGSLPGIDLKQNDGISSINGKEVKDLCDINSILQLENDYVNNEIELIVNRNDLEFKLSLPKK